MHWNNVLKTSSNGSLPSKTASFFFFFFPLNVLGFPYSESPQFLTNSSEIELIDQCEHKFTLM